MRVVFAPAAPAYQHRALQGGARAVNSLRLVICVLMTKLPFLRSNQGVNSGTSKGSHRAGRCWTLAARFMPLGPMERHGGVPPSFLSCAGWVKSRQLIGPHRLTQEARTLSFLSRGARLVYLEL
jgi:hypothetical protein